MDDDSIRERHGVVCRLSGSAEVSSITLHEGEERIHVDGSYNSRSLTPWQARYLAAKLYRLARRIRQRTEGQ